MNFEFFVQKVVEAVTEHFQDEREIRVEKVMKNNGMCLTGIAMSGKKNTAVPTIYLEQLFEQYEDGISFEEIMEHIFKVYEEKTDIEVDITYFTDYKVMRNKIMFKVIHYERNLSLFEKVPYIKWNDLAIVFYFIMKIERIGTGTVLIQKDHMKAWGVSADDLYKAAMVNMKRDMEEELISLQRLIAKTKQEDEEDLQTKCDLEANVPMYVLTNKEKMFGAATMLYSEKIRELSKSLDDSLFVIPSSVHELILVPQKDVENVAWMKRVIQEINRTELDQEEVLSDSLYYYDRILDEVTLAC